MKITVKLHGYVDWPEAPPNVKVTPEHFAAGKAKFGISSDKVLMRVPMDAHLKNDKGELDHPHECHIPEISIMDRYAALAMIPGKGKTREQVVAEMALASFTEHLDPGHGASITVEQDERRTDEHLEQHIEVLRAALLKRRMEFGFEHWRRFLAIQADPTLTDPAKKHQLDTWEIPAGTPRDDAKITQFAMDICSDTRLETLIDEYITDTDQKVEDYLAGVLGIRKKAPVRLRPAPTKKEGGSK